MSIDESIFLSKQTFSERIEQMVLQDGGTYFDAVIDFATMADKSPEELMPYMTQVLIDKIKKSCYDSGMMQNPDQPLDEI